MRKLLTVLALVGLSTGCAGITDKYRATESSQKAQIRIAIEDALGQLSGMRSFVKTHISDGVCNNMTTPPEGEVRPSPYNKSVFSQLSTAEREAKSARMAQDEKLVLDFLKTSGVDKFVEPSYLRYVFAIEAEKSHVFHFEYTLQPERSFREPGEKCSLMQAYRFEPGEFAEIRFRVLHDTTPASCQIVAVTLLGKPNEALVIPKIAEKFRGCP